MNVRALYLLPITLLFAPLAHADPVVAPGGKPGAALKWTQKGKVTTLELGEDFDAADVAQAIQKSVKGASAKASGTKVTVSGVDAKALLTALEKIDVEPVNDDVDAMLSAMQNPGGEEEGSGSSIRASKATDFSDVIGAQTGLITAKVTKVKKRRFPFVMLQMRVTKTPKGFKALKRGQRIKVVPHLKLKKGQIVPDNKMTKLNLGAWYAHPGDRVQLRLKKAPKGKLWIAEAFKRVR